MRIYISGASDDLVEIDGDVSLEGYAGSDNGLVVQINGQDAFLVAYEHDGVWSVTDLGAFPGRMLVRRFGAIDEEDPRFSKGPMCLAAYTEIAEVVGDFTSIKCGDDEWPTA